MNIRKSLSMLFVLCLIALPLFGQPVTKVRLWSLDYNSYLGLSWAESSSTNRVLSFYVSGESRSITLVGNFTLSGDNQVGLWTVTSTLTANSTILQAASQYHNWGATGGVNGYGFRDNAGTMEVKNSGGAWAAIPSSAGAIPSGLIAIFDAACPSGWTRVSAWDGLFLRGAATYGGTGGASTHVHSVDPPSTESGVVSTHDNKGHADGEWTDTEGPNHKHNVDIAAFNSAAASSLPPYIDVVFCKKD